MWTLEEAGAQMEAVFKPAIEGRSFYTAATQEEVKS
jgi:hypothetical protein